MTSLFPRAPRPAGPEDGPGCHGPRLSRRGFLLGLSAAVATVGNVRLALADAPGERRFIVLLLRGGMDGLGVVQPYGDPAFVAMRGALALPEPGREGGTLDLGGRYGLHPGFEKLHALYRADQALVLHAVAGPGRSRSHFEAQDLIESGAAQRLSSGWLNRALSAMPAPKGGGGGLRRELGLAVGLDVPLLLRGSVPVQNYAPSGTMPVNDDLMARIEGLLARDPAFGPAVARGREERRFAAAVLEGEAEDMMGAGGARQRSSLATLGEAAGRLMAAPDGPRVAALDLGGWDTHAAQMSRLRPAVTMLDNGLDALRRGLGEAAWQQTAILVITEFGRTARPNGSGGTDHGTAGAAFLVGGAVAGGRVLADWPGLGAGKLFEDRDLQPTLDLRSVAKGLLRDHLRLPPGAVEQAFPDSAAAAPLGRLVKAG